MKTVMVFGTFDFLHIGHVHLLEKAKKLGGRLVVAVARDKAVKKLKGRLPVQNEHERKKIISCLNLADKAVLGDKEIGKYRVVQRIKPDIIALGHDQHELAKDLKKFLKDSGLKVRLVRISSYSRGRQKSSRIKKALEI